ncbi:hypothetical protein Kpol_1000p17 [Vanderwaltozyma polyspora DSM 70294]|uniref:Mitochondrial genome maintenance protein MGM101 n=1 Tax=Vanderwaltozyma polyspora (strain ATCC 22028 / DSM 70294 / BCRC 21397 / CBS 2163 / NBRC 10782 / NRRL Y-8283 / UCD 57-17) TaxID=436907 RepID=A7TPV7_VANPO|nr:uncharacterized protein Kpol_1000p17 [Vanderwaltozyma polyspora DSM 70294]EDO15705.1 hypothetical protein Kpol_1000p17 [Vanderwaltozyma polyspora DSM 70294]
MMIARGKIGNYLRTNGSLGLCVRKGSTFVSGKSGVVGGGAAAAPGSGSAIRKGSNSGVGSKTLENGTHYNRKLEPMEVSNNGSISSKVKDEIDWYTSWYGLGQKPFGEDVQNELVKILEVKDIEIKPDGLIYLPEIKYRRILNKSFGAGGWGLVPRSDTIVTNSLVTREYGLICHGQLVSVARGEQDYFSEQGIPTATEGRKSNALMRCCKDLGVGSELWDPVFIKKFKKEHCVEKFVEHVTTGKKRKIWLRKDRIVEYPYKDKSF